MRAAVSGVNSMTSQLPVFLMRIECWVLAPAAKTCCKQCCSLLRCRLWTCLVFLQAQSRPTYYAPNQMTQMRPNPRWQQGGRPQGEHARDNILVVWPSRLYFPPERCMLSFPRTTQLLPVAVSWLAGQFCFEDFPSFLPLGFQGMPNAMRQSGPRPALRHLAPAGNAPASRGLPAAAQRVGKLCASQALPLGWEGGGCSWDLTFFDFQRWLSALANQRPPGARGRDSAWIFPSCAVQVWGQLVRQHKSRWVVFRWFGAHLYTSATLTTPKPKQTVGYGYCFQSRASKYILFQWITRKYLKRRMWNAWYSLGRTAPS